jgi:hypothetical protein
MATQFWIYDPTILLNKEHIFELYPTPSMTFEQKLNAMSRLIILISILGYIISASFRILVIGSLTLLAIYIFNNQRSPSHEGFDNQTKDQNQDQQTQDNTKSFDDEENLNNALSREFKKGTKKNPFSNVLLTHIADEPSRNAAPPAFHTSVDDDITKNVKRSVQMLNPGIKNTNKQLFGDLWQKFELDNCMRVFNSTPNSRVGNDQGAFAQYLYNDMKYSGKESTPEGAIARIANNGRWIDGHN